jgi:hypothetical protein
MDCQDGIAPIVHAAEHVAEFEIRQCLIDFVEFRLGLGAERLVGGFFCKFNKRFRIIDGAPDFCPRIDPLLFLIDVLQDFLRSDIVIPKARRGRAILQFRYVSFLDVEVKETPEFCRGVRGNLLPEALFHQT